MAQLDNQILTFIGFFLAGLAVNLTPCVYPMLTVTASLFRSRQGTEQNIKHSFVKALIYVLGMVVTYSTLGYLAASTGKLFGAALQNKWVLGSVGALMIALGLSMLGLFQIRVPSELLNKLVGLRKVNYLGLFLSGMLVGIFAAPCIGPPVLALLAAVANNGDPKFGFSAFFVFSWGLGLPYLIFGTFSNLLTLLPKAGNWLIWVERFFGVVLLGFGLFYLSLVFNVKKAKAEDSIWMPYRQEFVDAAKAKHEPVVIDFYADWCLNCHELEKDVFSKPAVQEKLRQLNTVRIDATHIDDPKIDALINHYGIIGLPTVIFLNNEGIEVKNIRVEGVVSQQTFSKALDHLISLKQKKEPLMMTDKNSNKIRIYQAATGQFMEVDKIVKSDEEWKQILTPEQFRVTREHGTEAAFCGLPTKGHINGIYQCVACGTDLFLVDKKFESGTGWPSFWDPINEANVGYTSDNSFGMVRTEVHCGRCSSHLGHVFDDGPPPTHKRYCINSVALKFVPNKT